MDLKRVEELVSSGHTHSEISNILKNENLPSMARGFSERSVRRFCKSHNLKRTIDRNSLRFVVEQASAEVKLFNSLGIFNSLDIKIHGINKKHSI